MQIQINTDNHIEGHQQLADDVEKQLTKALDRFVDHLTRIEVHLGDENANKTGQHDKRCLLEARPKNHQPIAVSAHAPSIQQAVTQAIEKLKRSLDHAIQVRRM